MPVTQEQLAALAACSGHSVAIDTETTGLKWFLDRVIGFGWYSKAATQGFIAVTDAADLEAIKHVLLNIWDPETTLVICHNMKFDFHFLGIEPRHFKRILDTTVCIHLMDSRYPKSLKEAERIFLKRGTKAAHVNKHPRKQIWDWPIDEVAAYCIDDCRSTLDLADVLLPKLKDMGLYRLLRLEMDYLKELWGIERAGLMVDTDFVNYGVARLQEDIDALTEQLYQGVGYRFNWKSATQLCKALYTDMGITKPKDPYADADGVYRGKFAHRTKYNSTSTNTFILLEKVVQPDGTIGHPLGNVVSLLREAVKLQGVLRKWPGYVAPDGRIHTNFNITGTRTGRLSSSEPALQNIPGAWRVKFTQTVFSGTVDRPDAYNLRKALVASPGCVLVSIDWKQQELRMFGKIANDPNMVPALQGGQDVHSFIADKVWGSHDVFHRGMAKSITFGLIYGTSTASLSHRLNMTRAEAKAVTEQYWRAFPAIKPFRDRTVANCERDGYIRNWIGRYWWEEDREHIYRGVNFLVQGGSADQLMIAVLRVSKFLRECGARSRIVSIVHDEVIYEMPTDELFLVPDLCAIMEVPDLFDLAFPTDVDMGYNMGEKVSLSEDEVSRLVEGYIPTMPVDESWRAEAVRLGTMKATPTPTV